jgi:predicted lipid carrier protein YhbT
MTERARVVRPMPDPATSDATAAFFAELAGRGREPLLAKVTGSVRFDLRENGATRHWHLSVAKGHVTVSRRNSAADCVVRADKALFDRVVTGRASAVTARLRGEIAVTGDTRLLVLVQRIFPGPPAGARA